MTIHAAAQRLTYAWDGGTGVLEAGALIDVPPGSALEAAIGAGNLVTLSQQQIDGHAMGGGSDRTVSN